MTLDNMTGITKGSYTGFCKRQLITCNRVKECNGVCPFEDALKHADKMQTMNEQHTVDHDRDWIIGCIEHDGFIHTHRGDKANQIILDALSAEVGQRGEWVWKKDAMDWGIGAWVCNKCGCRPNTLWSTKRDSIPLAYAGSRFCGNCGADMRGEEE